MKDEGIMELYDWLQHQPNAVVTSTIFQAHRGIITFNFSDSNFEWQYSCQGGYLRKRKKSAIPWNLCNPVKSETKISKAGNKYRHISRLPIDQQGVIYYLKNKHHHDGPVFMKKLNEEFFKWSQECEFEVTKERFLEN
jgi:hypothetical protein